MSKLIFLTAEPNIHCVMCSEYDNYKLRKSYPIELRDVLVPNFLEN
jgi:hypothetical protein